MSNSQTSKQDMVLQANNIIHIPRQYSFACHFLDLTEKMNKGNHVGSLLTAAV